METSSNSQHNVNSNSRKKTDIEFELNLLGVQKFIGKTWKNSWR
jgi:hypothetical protein